MLARIYLTQRSHQLAWGLWSAVLFLLPFNPFGALRNVVALALIFSLLLLVRKQSADHRFVVSYPLWIGCAIVLWSVIVSTLGPYPEDSWHAMRRDLLTQIALFLAPCLLIRSVRDVRPAVLAIVAGFVVVSLLSLAEITATGFDALLSHQIETAPRRHDAFWGGYAASSSIYLPLTIGLVVFFPMSGKWRSVLTGVILLITALTLFYGSRSALLILVLVAGIALLLARRFRLLLVIVAIVGVMLAGVYSQSDLGYLNKYKSLSYPETYVTNQGLGLRLAVWKGALEVIAERPWLGFGYGWKKLAWAINDGGFAQRWHAESPDLAQYYLQGAALASYGRVNPHNYPLQVVFEIGVFGFSMVLVFWGAIVAGCRALIKDGEYLTSCWGRIFLLVFIGYFMSNFSNGYWVGGVANLAVSCAGIVVALRGVQKNP